MYDTHHMLNNISYNTEYTGIICIISRETFAVRKMCQQTKHFCSTPYISDWRLNDTTTELISVGMLSAA